MTVHFEDVRDVGFFLCAAGWIVFTNIGVITAGLMIILGADRLIAGLVALKVECGAHEY